jgi:hypothetical protein
LIPLYIRRLFLTVFFSVGLAELVQSNRVRYAQATTTIAKQNNISKILRTVKQTGRFLTLTKGTWEIVSDDVARQMIANSIHYYDRIHSAHGKGVDGDTPATPRVHNARSKSILVTQQSTQNNEDSLASALNDIIQSFSSPKNEHVPKSLNHSISDSFRENIQPGISSTHATTNQSGDTLSRELSQLSSGSKKRSRSEESNAVKNDRTPSTYTTLLESDGRQCSSDDINDLCSFDGHHPKVEYLCPDQLYTDVSHAEHSPDYNKFLHWLTNATRSSNIYELLNQTTQPSFKTEINVEDTVIELLDNSELASKTKDCRGESDVSAEQRHKCCDDKAANSDPGIDVDDSITQFLLGTASEDNINPHEECDSEYTQLLQEFSRPDIVESQSIHSMQCQIPHLTLNSIHLHIHSPPLRNGKYEYPSAKRAFSDIDDDQKLPL